MNPPQNNKNEYVFGMIGLGTMGRSLLLNMADHGFSVAGYDKDPLKVEALDKEGDKFPLQAFASLPEFVGNLKKPRALMMLVPAGPIVDNVIKELLPLLDKGDLLIDGGNSHFSDTNRRVEILETEGIHFFGMGISGGEEGALMGPSMMPGGNKEAYQVVQPIFEAIAAKVNQEPCVTYIGPGSAGHFVKMVHNGIEYALMQLIAESYELLRKGLRLDNEDIHQVFKQWNEGRLQSFLLEITRDIFSFKEKETEHYLLDDILDVARSKGTGKWTSQVAMDLVLPVTAIDTAVAMRDLSKCKELRVKAAALYADGQSASLANQNREETLQQLEQAFYFCMVITYAQGMHLLHQASNEYNFQLQLDQIAKIWRGGCIIRAEFLESIFSAFQTAPALEHLLLDQEVQKSVKESIPGIRSIVSLAASSGLGMPAYAACLSYFDSFRNGNMPSNLIQAQRDYFGAHTYERIGKEGLFHHTEWLPVTFD